MKRSAAKTVDEYIASAPKEARVAMNQIRAAIKEAVPNAKEKISYEIPFYEYKYPGYKGRMAYFGAFKNHISLFIVPEKVPDDLSKQIKPYKKSKSALHFPTGTKVPVLLIKKLVKLRMKEIDTI